MSSGAKYKIVWLAWQPTPYNDFLFRSIAADSDVDLLVHFREKVLPSHPWTHGMAEGFKSDTYQRRFGVDWNIVTQSARDSASFFIIAGWNEPTVQGVALARSLRSLPFALWTDTPVVARNARPLRARARAAYLDFIFRHATHVMATGGPGVRGLAAMGCATEKLINFPFYVDLDALSPPGSRPAGPMTFLSSGRLDISLKGQDLSLRALAAARDRTRIREFRYRIAGTGTDLEALQRLARELDLLDNVEFTGWVEAKSLPAFLRSGHVFLHPARVDPFPVAVLEAMASGLPVLGSDASGSVLDRVRDGENGYIHKTNDWTTLSHHIEELLRDPNRAEWLGRNARSTGEQWPVSRAIEQLKRIIDGALPSRGAPFDRGPQVNASL